ncbi:MAG: hypothetical protein KC613_16755 [Myxococcales bacterium]|nr:hypothetical protein [Myxococcales bacterium]
MAHTLADLMAMDRKALHATLCAGHPVDPQALAEQQCLGVALMPRVLQRLLWTTFRKTFTADGMPEGQLRGWNVCMQQTGVDGPRQPRLDRQGRPVTFGHYVLTPADGLRFPGGWTGGWYLDYGAGRNPRWDPAGLGATPLVAVNPEDPSLLLGWEVFRLGPAWLPLPLYYALQLDGPLAQVVPPPR